MNTRHDTADPIQRTDVRPDTADQMDIRDPMQRTDDEPMGQQVDQPTSQPAPDDQSGTADWPEQNRDNREPDADDRDRTHEPADREMPDLWDSDTTEQLRARWHEVQLTFVDDPRAAAEKAETLVDEAARQLSEALSAQRVSTWRSDGDGGDTERLRQAVQRYREVFDRLLAV